MNKVIVNRFELEEGFDINQNKHKFIYVDFYPKFFKMANIDVTFDEIDENLDDYYIGITLSKNLQQAIMFMQYKDCYYTFFLQAITKVPINNHMVYEFEQVIDD